MQALQRHLVHHGSEGVVHRVPHLLGGGIRRHQLWELGLQVLQPPVEHVVLPVGDLRVVLCVVFPAVVPDLLPQLLQELLGLFSLHGLSLPSIPFYLPSTAAWGTSPTIRVSASTEAERSSAWASRVFDWE